MTPSKKLDGIPFSPIRKLFDEIARLRAEGKDVISLGLGETDFDTPANITEAMIKATREGATHYTPNKGIVPLREAIHDYLLSRYDVAYDLEEIICTAGVAEGVYIALSAYLDPGDEVLTPDPSWVNYVNVPGMNGAKAVNYTLEASDDFQVNVAQLEQLVTARTKMLVLLDPSNPTGAIQSKESLEKLAAFCIRHDLIVVADEIYDQMIYAGNRHYSIASFPGMRERTIMLNGFSKSYAMTGWRLGYMAAPMALIPPLAKMHAYILTNASSMVQYGGVEALTGPQDSVGTMVAEFERRRDFAVAAVNAIEGLCCNVPGGAFYVFADVSALEMTGEQFCELALRHGVGVIPGTAFGTSAVNFVRLSYAASMQQLKAAMERVAAAAAERRAELAAAAK